MSIKFGWSGDNKKQTPVNEDPFKGALVLILKALEGKRRQFEFSGSAIEKMGLYKRINGLEEQPEFSGTKISLAFDDINDEYFVFVNDNKFPDTIQININKTNCGFSDKRMYDFLSKRFTFDNTKDNYVLLEENVKEVDNNNLTMFKIAGVYSETPVVENVVSV